jgi:exportin-7
VRACVRACVYVRVHARVCVCFEWLLLYTHNLQPTLPSPPTPSPQAISEHLRAAPDLFPTLLSTLFEIVLFEDCTNQWSLSRPMLSLILINEQVRICGWGWGPALC